MFGERHDNPFGGTNELNAELSLSFQEAFNGTTKRFALSRQGSDRPREMKVRVPAGARDGSRLRLRGQVDGADLVLTLRVAPDKRFTVKGDDVVTTVAVAPWEAALGVTVDVPSPAGGSLRVTVPKGTPSGRKLRVSGKGMPSRSRGAGDLLVEVSIVFPKEMSSEEESLYRKLAQVSTFRPRETGRAA
jgi:curved DNA-binding protein